MPGTDQNEAKHALPALCRTKQLVRKKKKGKSCENTALDLGREKERRKERKTKATALPFDADRVERHTADFNVPKVLTLCIHHYTADADQQLFSVSCKNIAYDSARFTTVAFVKMRKCNITQPTPR